MSHITYYNIGKNKWLKRIWATQCSKDSFMTAKCQGVAGHLENHWSYSPSGNFQQRHSDGGCSTTPPSHKNYVSPVKMEKHRYTSHYSNLEVTDPAVIEMLERDEIPEDASIDRPVEGY